MKIAVVTPFHETPLDWLKQCLASVARQTKQNTHYLVVKDREPAGAQIPATCPIIRLADVQDDFDNAARAIGSISAICQGMDAIAYLDATSWYEPTHLQQLCDLHERTGAAVCSSRQLPCDASGAPLPGRDANVGDADTNCLFLTRKAFGMIAAWYLRPRSQVPPGSRAIWKAIKESGLSTARLAEATVHCRVDVDFKSWNKSGHEAAEQMIAAPSWPHVAGSLAPKSSQIDVCAALLMRTPSAAREKVSLCMIVRNEEKNLADCLRSARGLFDETVIVDTGSTDRTVEIARSSGAQVVDFPWVDDFAAARNVGIEHATGDWIFWLDADDRFDDANRGKLRTLLRNLPSDNASYMMTQWSVPEEPTTSALTVDHPRLFRKHPKVRWRFRIHEQILPALQENGAKIVHTDIIIGHLGYKEVGLRLHKIERNLRILHLEHADRPNEPFTLFNLAGSYLDKGEPEHAITYLHQCQEAALPGVSFLPKTYVLLTQCHRVLGMDDEALRHCQEGRKRFPKDIQLWYEEAMLHQHRKDFEQARHCLEKVLELPQGPCFVGVDAGLRGFRTRHSLAVVFQALKRPRQAEEQWRRAVQEAPDFGPAWLGLAELLLDENRADEIESHIRDLAGKPQERTIGRVLQARLSLHRRDVAAAFDVMEQAVADGPNSVWLRMLFTEMLIRESKDWEAAERQLKAVLQLNPQYKPARQKLAHVARAKAGATLVGATR